MMNKVSFCARLLAVAVVSGVSVSVVAAPVSGQGTWETSLQARDWSGNGVGVDAYYDPLLNLTWLADANYAQTSGFDADGLMNFSDANAWASSLTLFGGSDWRLPTLSPVNGSTFNTNFSNNGSTDGGYAMKGVGWGVASEMGFMFYVHLGNKGLCTPNAFSPASCADQSGWGLSNTGPFANLLANLYWTDEVFVNVFAQSIAWFFIFDDGGQANFGQFNDSRAWAVHSGDLIGPPVAPVPAPVPLPGAALLLGSALVAVGARARRR